MTSRGKISQNDIKGMTSQEKDIEDNDIEGRSPWNRQHRIATDSKVKVFIGYDIKAIDQARQRGYQY